MAGRSQTRRAVRASCLMALGVLLAAPSAVRAQPCDRGLPSTGAKPAPAGPEKFKFIAQYCNVLDEPATVHRAAQLDLYEGSRSVAVPMSGSEQTPEGAAQEPPAVAPATSTPPSSPPDRNAARVISLAPALTEAARAHDLDPLLLHAIAHVESRHNARAESPAGARGVMQVMPATGRRFGVADGQDLFHANTNVRAGAAYLRTLHKRFDGDLKLVLAAYNAGEGAVERHGRNIPPYAETQAYVRDVLAIYQRLINEFSVSPDGALIARGA
jgi:soluble lytic murein transglycosylase-like protein